MNACAKDKEASGAAQDWPFADVTLGGDGMPATIPGAGPRFVVRARTPGDALELARHASADDARAAFAGALDGIEMDDATRAAALDQLLRLRDQATASGALACGVLNAPHDDAWAFWTYLVTVLPRPNGRVDPAGVLSRLLARRLDPGSTVVEECESAGRPAVGVRAHVPVPAGPGAAAPFTDRTLTIGLAAMLVVPPDPACVVVVAATSLDPGHLDEITALGCLIANSIEIEPAGDETPALEHTAI